MRESLLFFFGVTPATEIYPLSLHDALPISDGDVFLAVCASHWVTPTERFLMASLSLITQMGSKKFPRSEEHTSELQSLRHLVCRLLLEKKKKGRQGGGEQRPASGC